MIGFVAVAAGGAVGSTLRYGFNLALPRMLGGHFPWATFFVNAIGCFAMGYLTALLAVKFSDDVNLRLFLQTGLLGGFTTFSAFSLDFVTLMQRGEITLAAGYAVGSVTLSIFAVLFGFKAFG